MQKIIGTLVFIVSALWLLAVQVHPLMPLFSKMVRGRSTGSDWLWFLPYPPPFGGAWWPVIVGAVGVMLGAGLVALSESRAQKLEEIEFRER